MQAAIPLQHSTVLLDEAVDALVTRPTASMSTAPSAAAAMRAGCSIACRRRRA
jgi:hypothetical protein